jgi:hypothetical protein
MSKLHSNLPLHKLIGKSQRPVAPTKPAFKPDPEIDIIMWITLQTDLLLAVIFATFLLLHIKNQKKNRQSQRKQISTFTYLSILTKCRSYALGRGPRLSRRACQN